MSTGIMLDAGDWIVAIIWAIWVVYMFLFVFGGKGLLWTKQRR